MVAQQIARGLLDLCFVDGVLVRVHGSVRLMSGGSHEAAHIGETRIYIDYTGSKGLCDKVRMGDHLKDVLPSIEAKSEATRAIVSRIEGTSAQVDPGHISHPGKS